MVERFLDKGVKILSETLASGIAAKKGDTVAYSARFFLRRGDEVTPDFASIEKYPGIHELFVVDGVELIVHRTPLGRRQSIAGIEKTLEGMTPGSFREVEIAPHLAYGEKGLGDLIPANALLRARVWLHSRGSE